MNDKLVDGLSIFLKDLSRTGFYGVVEVQFVDGQIVLVRKEESFKPAIFVTKSF